MQVLVLMDANMENPILGEKDATAGGCTDINLMCDDLEATVLAGAVAPRKKGWVKDFQACAHCMHKNLSYILDNVQSWSIIYLVRALSVS